MAQAKSKIFISYSHRDDNFAIRIATGLSQAGAYIWMDIRSIPAGMNWSSEIQKGLEQSDLMIVILSPESMKSQQVEKEWLYFLNRNKPIIPVMYRSTPVHYQLEPLQYIDFRKNNFDAAFDKVLDELKTHGFRVGSLGLPSTQTSKLSTKRETNWTKWSVISAVIIGFLAVVTTLAQPFITNMLSNNSTPTQKATNFLAISTPSITPTVFPVIKSPLPPANPTPTHTETPATINMTLPVASQKSADFKLTWNRDSMTILINGRTDLSGLILIIVNINGSENRIHVSELFPTFNTDGFIVDTPSTCLNIFRSNKLPVLSMACSGKIFKREVDESDVFWYDDVGNQLQNVIVQYGSHREICSAADQPCIVVL